MYYKLIYLFLVYYFETSNVFVYSLYQQRKEVKLIVSELICILGLEM